MARAQAVDDRCKNCKHHAEAHDNGLCSRCIGGKMRHKYEVNE